MNLEIWFPQQDEVSVFLESSITDPIVEQFYETHLFALYAARQIINLRTEGQTLAHVLQTTDPSRPLVQAEERLGEVRVTSSHARGGHKGFTASLRAEESGSFKLKARGFGMRARGVGYYAPTSTLALLCWLLKRREDDPIYQRSLAKAAVSIGLAGSGGTLKLNSQASVAKEAARGAWSKGWDALVARARADLEEMLAELPEGIAPPEEMTIPFCRRHVILDARLVEDERIMRATAAAEEATDETEAEAANAHLNEVIADVLEENELLSVADTLHRTLFIDEQ